MRNKGIDICDIHNLRHRYIKRLLIWVPIVFVIVISISFFFPACSELGADGRKDVVSPLNEDGVGFVGKSNDLLSHLLSFQDNNVTVNSLETLNKKYPAFEFQLPYKEEYGSNVMDVRLVNINPEYIKDEELLKFYYNSSIPKLLKMQRDNISDKYFKIRFRTKNAGRRSTVDVVQVSVIHSMFKVALEKNPWRGTILSNDNSMFTQDDGLYLVHDNQMMPIAKTESYEPLDVVTYKLYLDSGRICDVDGKDVDYYDYYMHAFHNDRKRLRIEVVRRERDRDQRGFVDFAYMGEDRVRIIADQNVDCQIFVPGVAPLDVKASEFADSDGKIVDFHEGMRIVLTDNLSKVKLTEFAIVSENPARVLSTVIQSSSGETRYWADARNADVFTRQMMRGIARNMTNSIGVDTVSLSVDPLLSKDLEKSMKEYIGKLKDRMGRISGERWEMSVTVMDMATGNILASPSVTDIHSSDEKLLMTTRNSSLIRRPVGSVFKPLLTLAAALTNPSVLDLSSAGKTMLESNNSGKGVFLGCRTSTWVPNQWGASVDMVNYLGYSHDIYPVIMTALCLDGHSAETDLNTVRRLGQTADSFFRPMDDEIQLGNKRTKMTDYQLIRNLASLYSIHSYNESTDDYSRYLNYYLWDNLFAAGDDREMEVPDDEKHFGLDEISPDVTNMRYDAFDEGKTLRNHLSTWVLGQGDNDWSCIKLAEAWTRMITKRKVNASFVLAGSEAGAEPEKLTDLLQKSRSSESFPVNDIWNSFLNKFEDAQELGTLREMNNAVNALNRRVGRNDDELVLFAKTGTPDEYFRREINELTGQTRKYDVGQFVFSLVPSSSLASIEGVGTATGITCVVRITRSYTGNAPDTGLWSMDARDFYSNNSENLNRLYYMTYNYY